MRERFVSYAVCVSQWPNWLRRQYSELEIVVRIPAMTQIFLSKIKFQITILLFCTTLLWRDVIMHFQKLHVL